MIEVIKAGLLSSIQDLGRFGHRDQGVPLSGAMDQYSAALANQLLGNDNKAAVLEFAIQGPCLLFHQSCSIAIAGMDWKIELNGQAQKMNELIQINAGDSLECTSASKGHYAYLAVEGGFDSEQALGSYSFYPGILDAAKLKRGQMLKFKKPSSARARSNSSINFQQKLLERNTLAVFPGADLHLLSDTNKKALLNGNFQISKDSNRMAYLLQHELELKANEITTAPVEPGTVQLTPSGKMMVLMRDAQTTGGYARILQLTPMAINQLAQKRAGEEINFEILA